MVLLLIRDPDSRHFDIHISMNGHCYTDFRHAVQILDVCKFFITR